ncbi:uncharacterized protein LOC141849893 [Brevipalpus obovatus]|uniref:uncharacterized protein LOC141849893 n=1 Tax=Brevipalpus obovatus TaxID=246614 RepID=UPI003D9F785B
MDSHGWIDTVPDINYEYMFGVRKPHFESIRQYLTSSAAIYCGHTELTNDLAMYLLKLKHGVANRLLSSLSKCSLAELNTKLNRVRDALRNEFASKMVGFSTIERTSALTKYSRKDLYTALMIPKENAILIEDGISYIIPNDSGSDPPYINMESVIIFTPTGYIVDVVGPVLLEEPEDEQPIFATFKQRSDWLQENDLIISNSISRKAMEPYENLSATNVSQYVPRCDTPITQHKTDIIRYEIKMVRSLIRIVKNRIRSFGLIDKPSWQDRLTLHTDLMNVCAIINYVQRSQPINIPLPHSAITTYDSSTPDSPSETSKRQWDFEFVPQCSLSELRTTEFKKISVNYVAFPSLSREDVRDHTLEVFQIRRHYGLQVKSNGSSSPSSVAAIRETSIWEPCSNNLILKTIFDPDHFSHSELDTYFWFSVQNRTNVGWMCTCELGLLGIWCCHHVATVIQDLSSRFQPYAKSSLVGNAA